MSSWYPKLKAKLLSRFSLDSKFPENHASHCRGKEGGGGEGVWRRTSFTRGSWGSGDPQELINKIILVVGYVTLIDRQMKFINLWNSSRTGIDKVD